MENKSEGNENKIIFGDLNCTLDKMDRDGGNKTQRIYRCGPNYALSKLIVDNGLEDLRRKENSDSSEFTRYDRSSGTRSRIDRIYAHIKIANNTKVNHIMVSFTDHYDEISLERLSSKIKLEKVNDNSLLCQPEFSSTKKNLLFLLKKQRNPFV